MQCLSFCVWLTALSIMSSRPMQVVSAARVSFLFEAEYYPIVWMDHIYPSIHPSMLTGWLPRIGYHDQCCDDWGCANTPSRPCFQFFQVYTQIAGSQGGSICNVFEELPYCIPQGGRGGGRDIFKNHHAHFITKITLSHFIELCKTSLNNSKKIRNNYKSSNSQNGSI